MIEIRNKKAIDSGRCANARAVDLHYIGHITFIASMCISIFHPQKEPYHRTPVNSYSMLQNDCVLKGYIADCL